MIQDPKHDDVGTIIFYAYTVLNILLVARDWFKDVQSAEGLDESESEYKEESYYTGKFFLSNIADVIPLAFMFVVCATPSTLWTVLLVLFILFSLRECFQLVASFNHYFNHRENYIELGITICTAVILFNDQSNHKLNRNLAAFAIVLSWFELITLFVQHPRFTR